MSTLDPTRTATLRKRYGQAMNRRFRALAKDIRKSLVDNDALGLIRNQEALPHAFDFPTDSEKADAFMSWLRSLIDAEILEVIRRSGNEILSHDEWQNIYVRAAYQRGMTDATTLLASIGVETVAIEAVGTSIGIGIGVGAPIHANTLALMYTRNFSLLRGITEAMSQQISEILTQGLVEGVGPRVMAKRITDSISDISRKRALVLARTEVIRTYAEATLNTLETNGVEEVTPDVEFLTAGDSRVCEKCLSLEGQIFTIQQARGMIPRHPRCLAKDAIITSSPNISAAFKRWYDGDMLVFNTARGNNLTCTPNHPILTRQGWVAAKFLDAGDEIVCSFDRHWSMLQMTDSNYMPTRIEDIAESVFSSSKVTTREMPVSPEDFYADGGGSQVCIVGANIELMGDVDSQSFEPFAHHEFEVRNSSLVSKPCLGSSASLLESIMSASCGSMSCRYLTLSCLWGHLDPFDSFGFGLCSPGYTVANQICADCSSTHIESMRQLVLRHPGFIKRDYLFRENRLRFGSNNSPLFFEKTDDSRMSGSKLFSDLSSRNPSSIFFDNIRNISVTDYHDYVYDLETDGGYFVSDNIIVSNCRCTWVAANFGESEAYIKRREDRNAAASERLKELRDKKKKAA